ncbi:ARMT1-like domain-containing protein [Spirochaeta isovalerica]|uniref:Damage-control phosphatase ARMT1-like metal-binding domain-containing protein n=1 Tax=Spirochaeta isovalerica TaxID=150 RepID=A0A841RDP0_9SPIO|nr:ARMT1-like domain-containing protein [Spirochaeta isovalerica]MBB6481501.1 hypothetical protein [Spirochaeta isovalerica]
MNDQITTAKEGSFARFTIEKRVPSILSDLVSHNRFSSAVEFSLKAFMESVPAGSLTTLDTSYPFSAGINASLENHCDYNWLNAPFLFLENYLYHKIAEICGFFSNRHDYFLYKKEADIRGGREKISRELQRINSIHSFPEISLLNLMGNRADLSQSSLSYSADSKSELLIDHREQATDIIAESRQVHIVLDNAGEELFYDLLMVYWFFKNTGIRKIHLHFKQLPYFVSDALISDYRHLLKILSEDKTTEWFVRDMNRFEEEEMLVLSDNPYWSSGELYSQIPERLAGEFSDADLVIFKGDLNYRRLVGDNDWKWDTETASLVNYFPSDILISRILKCEVMTGLDQEAVPDRNKTEWMFSGNYGQLELVRSHNSGL